MNLKDKKHILQLIFIWFVHGVITALALEFISKDKFPETISLVLLHGGLLFTIYLYSLMSMVRNLIIKESEIFMIPIVYILMVIIFAIHFAKINSSLNLVAYKDWFDCFYYSIISMTTVGYGEIIPTDTVGKIVSIEMALLGVVHTGVFISVLFYKLSISEKIYSER